MWNRWQGRRLHPSEYYKGFNVSTSWASYVTQLVYYTCQSFNSDPGWMNLFVQGAPRPVTRPLAPSLAPTLRPPPPPPRPHTPPPTPPPHPHHRPITP